MRLTRDLSTLFALLVVLALLAYATPGGRSAGMTILWLAFLVLAFLLLAMSAEMRRLERRMREMESCRDEGKG